MVSIGLAELKELPQEEFNEKINSSIE